MEQVIAPPEIVAAIRRGDLEAIKAWVAAGGDPNAKIDCSHEQRFVDRGRWQQPLPHGSRYETLIHTAAYFKRPDICEFLLSRGARVDAMDATEGCPTPLWYAVTSCDNIPFEGNLTSVRVMLSYGADPNLRAAYYQGGGAPTPLCQLLYSGNLVDNPITAMISIVETLLRSGADPEDDPPLRWYQRNLTAEEHACMSRDFFRRRLDNAGSRYETLNVDVLEVKAAQCAKVVDLLAAVRIAGSWPRYFLRPHMSCMVFRALCQRERATYDHRTPTVLVYLFGAPPSRGYALWREQKQPLRLLRNIDPNMPDLPDVVFWRVLTFMFGTAYDYPWVRPRLRARAAAAAAA